MAAPLSLWSGDGTPIGRSVGLGHTIRLKDPKRSTYVIGTHGTGKSTLLLNLILADIARQDKGVVVLDPHGDLARAVIARCPPDQAGRVTYFAPLEQRDPVLGLNPFEMRSEREYELKVEALMHVFAHTWYGNFSQTPTLQNTLETLVRTLLAAYQMHHTSFVHMLLLTRLDETGDRWRRTLSQAVMNNPALRQNWHEWEDRRRLQTDMESSRQKIKHMITSDVLYPILCQPTSAACFRFQEVLSQNGVLLVNLEGLEEEGQRLLGSVILTQLLVMARLREDAADRVPCHIYADEFYKFSPQSFVTIINEARKYKLFCTLAHQNLAQLSATAKAAAGSCGNVIVFRVNPQDAGILNAHFLSNNRPLSALYLANLHRFHALVRYADQRYRRQAEIKTFAERGQPYPEVAPLIRQQSLRYGRSRAAVEAYVHDILNPSHAESRPPIRQKAKTPHKPPRA